MSINCSSMLACPTCGPNCNYECENGVCVEKPRDDNRVGVSKTRGVPSKGSTNYGPRGQRQNFRSFTGTNWQQAGRNRETMWQNGGVFSNASGRGRYLPTGMDRRATPNASNQWLAAMPGRAYSNACGDYSNANGARRANLQGTDWQTSNMSNACGGCA